MKIELFHDKNKKSTRIQKGTVFAHIAANIGIADGKIAYIGGEQPEAAQVLDAKGRIVSPGFIDIHMHEDDLSESEPKMPIFELMLKMGVTTVCGGNCGMQVQPLSTLKKRIDELGGIPVNLVMQAGYNTFREHIGLRGTDPMLPQQRIKMKELLAEELAQGAFGISFGIEYDPAITFEDMLDALSLLTDPRAVASAHFRLSGSGAIESLKEMNALSEQAGVKFQISHLSSCSATGQMEESLQLIDEMKKENPLLDFDTYPYNAFSTKIGSEVFGEESLAQWCEDIGDIMLTKEPYKNVFCTDEILKKVRAEYPEMLAVGFTMREEEIAMALADENGMVASDGILFDGLGHPRASGTFPRVLGRYVREQKTLPLLTALRKMTIKPTDRLSLSEKGRICLGADGDLTVFDPDTISDGATYDDVYIQSEGIDYVILDGEIAMDHKKMRSRRLGRFIPFSD